MQQTTNQLKKTMSPTYQNNPKARKASQRRRALPKAMMIGRRIYRPVENASINYAPQRRSIRRSDQELKRTSIASSVKIVMKTTITISTASFANKYTQIIAKTKMMISGSDATIANDG